MLKIENVKGKIRLFRDDDMALADNPNFYFELTKWEAFKMSFILFVRLLRNKEMRK